jgi:hypothetical protein
VKRAEHACSFTDAEVRLLRVIVDTHKDAMAEALDAERARTYASEHTLCASILTKLRAVKIRRAPSLRRAG